MDSNFLLSIFKLKILKLYRFLSKLKNILEGSFKLRLTYIKLN